MPLMIVALLAAAASTPPDEDDKPQSAVPVTAPKSPAGRTVSRPRGAALPADDDDKRDAGSSAPPKEGSDEDEDEGKAQPATAVVITGRKLDVARTQINPALGATVYSLGNDAIDDRPGGETSSMAVMLAQTPGVGASGDALTIRGSKDVQVRINDVIVPEAVADPADHLSIRLAQTTRVITGTLPAQYGFVPAGVISVTTKNGLYRHGGELEFYAGSNGFIEPAFEWAGSVLGTSLFASGSLQFGRSDVADLAGDTARDRSREAEGLAFADRILGPEDRISFILGRSHERHRIGATSLPAGVEESGDNYGVATYQHSSGSFTVQSSLFFGGGTNKASFADRTRERRSTFGTQIDLSFDTGGSHVIRGGLLASRSTAHEGETGRESFEAHRNAIGVYVQDEWKLASKVTFNPGLRADWLRGLNSKAEFEPRASFVWTSPAGLTAHVGYARYVTAAPLDDEAGTAPLPIERDDYFDAGVQYRLGALTLGADAYVRSTRNYLTERQSIGSALSEGFAFRRARFKGLELSATYATKPLSAWVNMSLSKSRGRDLIDNSGLFSLETLAAAKDWVRLSSERPVSGSAGVTWRSGKLALSGTVTASSGVVRSPALTDPNGARDGAYATVGLSAIYHAGLGGRLSDFRVDLTNLTNVRYLTNDASNLEGGWTRRARGRAITLGIEQGF